MPPLGFLVLGSAWPQALSFYWRRGPPLTANSRRCLPSDSSSSVRHGRRRFPSTGGGSAPSPRTHVDASPRIPRPRFGIAAGAHTLFETLFAHVVQPIRHV